MATTGRRWGKSLEERFWRRVERAGDEECWLFRGAPDRGGYGVIREGGSGSKTIKAHRASWQIHFGVIPEGMCVCHRCDNPPCVNPRHLFLGTSAENVADRDRKGRQTRGEHARSARLTASDARAVRDMRARGVSQREVAERFSMTLANVSKIARRLSWKHV